MDALLHAVFLRPVVLFAGRGNILQLCHGGPGKAFEVVQDRVCRILYLFGGLGLGGPGYERKVVRGLPRKGEVMGQDGETDSQ